VQFVEAFRRNVVRQPGTAASSLTRVSTADLTVTCRTRLSSYKVPKDFVVMDALPKLVSGKNARRLVKNRLCPTFLGDC